MDANTTVLALIVSAGLAGVIIWALDWRSRERSEPKENVRARTPNRLYAGRSQAAK